MKFFLILLSSFSWKAFAIFPIYSPIDGKIIYGNCGFDDTACYLANEKGEKVIGRGYVAYLFSNEQVEKCPILLSKSYSEYVGSLESKIELCKIIYFYSSIDVTTEVQLIISDGNLLKNNIKKGDLIGYAQEEEKQNLLK